MSYAVYGSNEGYRNPDNNQAEGFKNGIVDIDELQLWESFLMCRRCFSKNISICECPIQQRRCKNGHSWDTSGTESDGHIAVQRAHEKIEFFKHNQSGFLYGEDLQPFIKEAESKFKTFRVEQGFRMVIPPCKLFNIKLSELNAFMTLVRKYKYISIQLLSDLEEENEILGKYSSKQVDEILACK